MKSNIKGSYRTSSVRMRRRSQRLTLRYPLIAYSYSESTGKMRFRETTQTVKVSAHGGLIPLDAALRFGETFMLKHRSRPEEHTCKVVFLGSDNHTGKNLVGFEFTSPEPDFWHIYFPPVVAKSNTNGNGGSFYVRE